MNFENFLILNYSLKMDSLTRIKIITGTVRLKFFSLNFQGFRRKLPKMTKWSASSRWSFNPNSTWGSIETTKLYPREDAPVYMI